MSLRNHSMQAVADHGGEKPLLNAWFITHTAYVTKAIRVRASVASMPPIAHACHRAKRSLPTRASPATTKIRPLIANGRPTTKLKAPGDPKPEKNVSPMAKIKLATTAVHPPARGQRQPPRSARHAMLKGAKVITASSGNSPRQVLTTSATIEPQAIVTRMLRIRDSQFKALCMSRVPKHTFRRDHNRRVHHGGQRNGRSKVSAS